MAVPYAQHAFTLGEVAPGLFGRQDLARLKVAASTMRNMWPKFSGGAYSRAGTAFVGFSKQTGRSFPPRLVPFQFNLNQGLVLEFGNFYMRVISDGGYVTESALPISNISNANPAVVTMVTNGAASATANNGAVTSSYAPGDLVTLAGGTFAGPAILSVTSTQLLALHVLLPGGGVYAPADTIHVTGGTQTTAVILTVSTTKVTAATIAAGGAGGTNGTATVTGTTGTGTAFQASVTIAGGAITAVNSITLAGSYTANPAAPANEPVTGAGLIGAQLNVELGVATFAITNAGIFTVNPTGGSFTQASTSGSGTGATFSGALMGIHVVAVNTAGGYSVFPANPVSQSTTTGTGHGATFNVTWVNSPLTFANGDWVSLAAVQGMTEVNGETFVVHNVTATTFQLFDVYGSPIDASAFQAYSTGGTASRIYTVATAYAEADLEWLKWAQSADTLTICCLNQETNVPYQPRDLVRHSDTNWTFSAVVAAETIDPPSVVNVVGSAAGNAFYLYAVTAINPADGSESVAAYGQLFSAVDIAATPASITITWASVPTATQYNVYKAAVTYNTSQNIGMPLGRIASIVDGQTTLIDSNIVPDFNTVPPTYENPFPSARDFPSVVSYVQERRVFANSLNAPDTYVMSQPGSFSNFDTRVPAIDSDSITGTPWSVQVNGIQWMIDRPGGLVVLTGTEAWQLTGTGGSSLNPQPLTPANQQAQPQAFNGSHNHVPPLVIAEDILYVQAKGSIVRDLAYSFYTNVYTGTDLTLNSSHLFLDYQIQEWCWTEEPYKLAWSVRTDGSMLSLTYLKAEQITAWARHDTQGLFKSVCAVTETPVDALYTAVQRKIGVNTAYTVERMDNRIWQTIDQTWCVDCGLALSQSAPNATLTISSATGTGVISAPTVVDGGTGWSGGTQIFVYDDNGTGPGAGAVVHPTIVGGVITGLVLVNGGTGYVNPQFSAWDPAGSEGGSGFEATCTLLNPTTLTASLGVFNPGSVGKIVRAGGGIIAVIAYSNATQVTGNILSPVVQTVPDTVGQPVTIASGSWTMTQPVTTVTGLSHLIGATVTGVADGEVITPRVVQAPGVVTLDAPASNVVIGLGFTAQIQSIYLDTGASVTVQGQRKKEAAVTVRIEASRAFEVGTNQPDGSTLSPPQLAPTWAGMTVAPDQAVPPFGTAVTPMFTGDVRVSLQGGYSTHGQVAVQQRNPLPLNVLSIFPEDWAGDTPQYKEPQRGKMQQEAAG